MIRRPIRDGCPFICITLFFAVLVYDLDLLFRPFVYLFIKTRDAYRWVCGIKDEVTVVTLKELEWRGPSTAAPVDNDFYRDKIRARNLENRKPNHLVVAFEGGYARIARPAGRIRTVNRHGQLWDVGEVVSASSVALRRMLEAAPGKTLCLCRATVCAQDADALHIKAYAGIQENLELKLHGNVYSPVALCGGFWGRMWMRVRKGCGCSCIRTCTFGCCSRRRPPTPHADGTARHPDSESEVEEMGACRADCIAWLERNGPKATVLSRQACPDAAMPRLTPLLHRDVATSDVSGFGSKDGVKLAPLCRAHSNQYLVARQPDRCSVEGCNHSWTSSSKGVKLCVAHLSAVSGPEPPTRYDYGAHPKLIDAEEADEAPTDSAARVPPPPAPHSEKRPQTRGASWEMWVLAPPAPRPPEAIRLFDFDSDVRPNQGPHYFRFLGTKKVSDETGRTTVTVPALGLELSLHNSIMGVEDAAWCASLKEMKVPAFAVRPIKDRTAFQAAEGSDETGVTM